MRTPEQVIATLKQYEADHRRTNRLPYADEYRDAIDLIETLQREHNLLAAAIGNAAVRAGICRADADLTGPHLLMLANDMADCILDQAAPLAQQPASAVPDGWKLVPIEPTKEQLFDAAFNLSAQFGFELVQENENFARAVYRELLAASPTAQAEKECGDD